MADDFTQCMLSNSRMAARAITRRYDAYLRPHGMTATQLSLLGSIRTLPGSTVSQLAEARGFERTTLTRNLDRLEQMGLVTSTAQGRGRIAEMTPKGAALLRELAAACGGRHRPNCAPNSHPKRSTTLINTLKQLSKV